MFFDKSKVIKETIYINENGISQASAFNISYGVDKNFLFGAAISMTSVIINNKNIKLSLHIFTDYIDTDYITRAKKLSAKFDVVITIYLIDTNCFVMFPSHKWPLATYFRFITFELLSESLTTLLYLDADVICKGSIEPLTTLNLDHHFAAAVPDIDPMQPLAAERLEMEEIKGFYFNAGFLYVNLTAWKINNFTEKAVSLLCDPIKGPKLKYQDQDALNLLFFKNTIMLPRKFNCIYTIKSELKDKKHNNYREIITDESVFIHYVGATKPWHEWSKYPSTQFFDNAYTESTWHDIPLLTPNTKLLWKKKSKHEFKRYHIISGIISRITSMRLK